MAVHTSNVDPLPHQITAVYESMLPRQPLRYVLADDPGAGKTIMAGLYIRELIMRADARRVLIVCPGSLVEQWQDELSEKFGLVFPIYSKELETASSRVNPFEDHNQLIVRLDQMSRNEELQEKLCRASWDLVVFDEAHKLSAHFEDISLKDLLLQAIRYGDQPGVRARLGQRIENALDHDHLRTILERNALAQESMTIERLFSVKEEMEKAEARRLQPYFVRSFFMKAFEALGGSIRSREAARFEITHVPASIRERDRLITGRNRRELSPVVKCYERVCFTREAVRPLDRPGALFADMLHPGHPLMLAISDIILEKHSNLLRQGAIFIDPADDGDVPHLLFMLTHEIKSGDGQVLSKRLQFVKVAPDGSMSFAGWAPHLDLEALSPADRPLLDDLLSAPWICADQEQSALALAAATLVPEHHQEVAGRRIAHVDKTLAAVHERLTENDQNK
jgi:hypothetical protein